MAWVMLHTTLNRTLVPEAEASSRWSPGANASPR